MPLSKARCSAAIDSSSSCGPQPKRHGPPMAQVPTPTTEISGPWLPSLRTCMVPASRGSVGGCPRGMAWLPRQGSAGPPRGSGDGRAPRAVASRGAAARTRASSGAVGAEVDRLQPLRRAVVPADLGARAALAQDHVGGVVAGALEQGGADRVGVDRHAGALEGGDALGVEAAGADHPDVVEALGVEGAADVADELGVDAPRVEVAELVPERAVDQGAGGVEAHPPEPLAERP